MSDFTTSSKWLFKNDDVQFVTINNCRFHAYKMDAVKAAVEKRQADLVQQWSQYLPEQLELVENYQLVTSGNYILFAISEQADAAVTAFNTYTK